MADDATTTPESPPSGGRTATEFRDIADNLRARVDLFGKTLAAVATLGTTAVGLDKIGDLFPAEDQTTWVVGACLGLAVAALAAICVAVRLMNVARPIFMRADLDSDPDLDTKERDAVRPVYAAAAKRFGYSSLIGLEERERSLRTAAAHATDEDERGRRTALADEVKTEIEQALARGQVVAIRRRATRAVSDPGAWILYGAVIGGLLLFALGADKISSDRKDSVAEAKACGDARKAGATDGELGRTSGVCDGAAEETPTPTPQPSTPQARADIANKLTGVLTACTALTTKEDGTAGGPLSTDDCNAVRKAVSSIDPAP